MRNRRRWASSIDGKPSKPRPEGRGLGPFTCGHLTIIIVTSVIVVAFPFAAYAVTGSNIFITDFTSGAHAKVDSKSNLNTAIHDATAGTAAKVNASGQLLTSAVVAGSVNALGATPAASFFTDVGTSTPGGDTACSSSTGICASVVNNSGKNLVVTSVTVDNDGSSPERWTLVVCPPNLYNIHGCDVVASASRVVDLNFTGQSNYSLQFPSGVVVPNGNVLVLADQTGGVPHAFLSVSGYKA
jgi:hypothetical protein